MKILVIPSWYPNKENNMNGIFFKEQVEALKESGVDVIVLSINILNIKKIIDKNIKKGLQVTKENGVYTYRYYTYNYFPRMTELYLRYYGKLLNKYMKKIEKDNGNIDLVHIHSAIDAGIAYRYANIKKKYIITEHSSKYQRDLLNTTQKKYLEDVFCNASEVICVGDGLKDSIQKYCSNKKIKIIPNMISLKEEKCIQKENREKFRIFSLGLLTKTKGMDILIEAFSKYRSKLKNCELYIGGDGEESENLKALIKERKLSQEVKLLGKLERNQVNYEMYNCDMFALASRFETFGIVFLEAMTYGKPVVGTKTGGPDTFINESNGIVVPVNDIDSMGKALVEIYSNYNRYNSEVIKENCSRDFSKSAICDKIIKVYKDII